MTGEQGWAYAQKCLQNSDIVLKLKSTEPASIIPSRLKQVRSLYFDNDVFPTSEEAAGETSAGAVLCAWVRAIHEACPKPVARPASAPAATSATTASSSPSSSSSSSSLLMRPKPSSKAPAKAKGATAVKKFKGKPPVIASSTDSNPWDYPKPRKPNSESAPTASMVKASQEQKVREAAAARKAAEEAAEKARALALARVKVANAKLAEQKAREAAISTVKKPERQHHRPLTAPKVVYSTKASDEFKKKKKEEYEAALAAEQEKQRRVPAPAHMVPVFQALKDLNKMCISELRALSCPPVVVKNACEGICVLVGEEPGWVPFQRLLRRKDFIPTLARSTVTSIPEARLKKFRAQYIKTNLFPSVDMTRRASVAASVLCAWAWAIYNSSNDDEYTSSKSNNRKIGSGEKEKENEGQKMVHMHSSATVGKLAAAVKELRSAQDSEVPPLPSESKTAQPTVIAPLVPTMKEAFAALKALSANDCKQISAFKSAPPAVETVMAGICVLVGEVPGWVMSSKLLARSDFVPTLASCGPDRIPQGRVNKFRATILPKFPTLVEAEYSGGAVALAMAMWILAINHAFPIPSKVPVVPASTASFAAGLEEKKEKRRNKAASATTEVSVNNPLKVGAARVPTPEKRAELAAASVRAAAGIDPKLSPADLRKMMGGL